ncbi:hypothetical protein Dda_2860 [Drechslerella dactyloides]|uniref:Uncharacterized protein n=1 Tax=Drechslerella dactyloides TaxID=74499 RepID=A0AAD6NKY9_DREDA|nr:hypothetical protein Dda_2860 [Drechslerella dactyloides]
MAAALDAQHQAAGKRMAHKTSDISQGGRCIIDGIREGGVRGRGRGALLQPHSDSQHLARFRNFKPSNHFPIYCRDGKLQLSAAADGFP